MPRMIKYLLLIFVCCGRLHACEVSTTYGPQISTLSGLLSQLIRNDWFVKTEDDETWPEQLSDFLALEYFRQHSEGMKSNWQGKIMTAFARQSSLSKIVDQRALINCLSWLEAYFPSKDFIERPPGLSKIEPPEAQTLYRVLGAERYEKLAKLEHFSTHHPAFFTRWEQRMKAKEDDRALGVSFGVRIDAALEILEDSLDSIELSPFEKLVVIEVLKSIGA